MSTMGPGGRSVAVIGAGGNIGSHLVPLLARLAAVTRILLVDPDVYTRANVAGQAITAADVDRPKVIVQARRIQEIRPDLDVRTIQAHVEDVPLARLRADLLLAGLDSRAARLWVNRAAMRLGRPYIDAGVRTDLRLVRIDVLRPGPGAPCLECAWDEGDYDAIQQRHACSPAEPQAPTAGIAALGALAAALQALEAERLLAHASDGATFGRQIILDARHGTHLVTTLVRNPRCRCDHTTWAIQTAPGPDELTFGEALGLVGRDDNGPASIAVEGRPFVRAIACPRCGRGRRTLHLEGRLPRRARQCPGCATAMLPVGFESRDRLTAEDLGPRELRRPLRAFGFCEGDVLTVARAGGGPPEAAPGEDDRSGTCAIRHFALGGG